MFYTIPMSWGSYGCCFTLSPCQQWWRSSCVFVKPVICQQGHTWLPRAPPAPWDARPPGSLASPSMHPCSPRTPPPPTCLLRLPWVQALHPTPARPTLAIIPAPSCRELHHPSSACSCPQGCRSVGGSCHGNFTCGMLEAIQKGIELGDVGGLTKGNSRVGCWRAYRREFMYWDVGGLTKGEFTSGMLEDLQKRNSLVGCWKAYRMEIMCGMLEDLQKRNSLVGCWRTYKREIHLWDVGGLTKGNSIVGGWRAYRRKLHLWDVGGLTKGIQLWDVGGLIKGNSVVGCWVAYRRKCRCGIHYLLDSW